MRQLVVGFSVAALVAACPSYKARSAASLSPKPVGPVVKGEIGIASWYGEELNGNLTASGSVFDMNRLSAAHRSLPLGTVIRVTNLRNKRWVLLRVTDRGPVLPNRLLDVSREAANVLGFLERGIVVVRVEVVRYPKSLVSKQIGAYPPH